MRDLRIGTLFVIGGAFSIMAFGCELITSVDRSAIPAPKPAAIVVDVSSSSGSGGSGGMGGMGGSAGQGGMGGSGGIVQVGMGGSDGGP